MRDVGAAKDYVQSTQAVLNAGRLLQASLGEDASTLDFAIEQLELAAKGHTAKATGYRAFMFAGEEASAPAQTPAAPTPTPVSGAALTGVFASVMAELQVADVFLAAGQNLGETDEEPRPELLAQALAQLEQTTPQLDGALAAQLAAGASSARRDFSEEAAPSAATATGAGDSPAQTFQELATHTLDTIVTESCDVATSIYELLKDLGPDKILEVLQRWTGSLLGAAGATGRLISQGCQKIKAAIEGLISLLGQDALRAVKAQLEKLWAYLSQQNLGPAVMADLIGVNATKKQLAALDLAHVTPETRLTEASQALRELEQPYKDSMKWAKRIAKALGIAVTVLGFTALIGPHLVLFAASAYLLVLGAAILISMDYADSGRILGRVRGVGLIAGDLRG